MPPPCAWRPPPQQLAPPTWWVTSTVALSRNMPRTQCWKMCWAVWWSTADSALSYMGGGGVVVWVGWVWVRRRRRLVPHDGLRQRWSAAMQSRRAVEQPADKSAPRFPHQQHQVSIKVGGASKVEALALAARQVDAAQAGLHSGAAWEPPVAHRQPRPTEHDETAVCWERGHGCRALGRACSDGPPWSGRLQPGSPDPAPGRRRAARARSAPGPRAAQT